MQSERFEEKLLTMLTMQDELDANLMGEWYEMGLPWHRGVYSELNEVLDCIGWKWWHSKPLDRSELIFELADVWHFAMGSIQEKYAVVYERLDRPAVARLIRLHYKCNSTDYAEWSGEARDSALRTVIDKYIAQAAGKKLNIEQFRLLCEIAELLDITFDDIFFNYLAKHTLCRFRQLKGIHVGRYQKRWGERTDNEVLLDIVRSAPASVAPKAVPDYIMERLETEHRLFIGE